jgi:hypothetical protein
MARSTRRRVRTQDEEHRTGRALNVPGQEPPVRPSPAPTRSSSSTPKEESSSPVRRTPYEEWMNRDRDTSELDRYMTRGRLDKLPPINPNVQTPSLQLHNSPLMQLLVDFGVTDSPFSPFTPSGIDKPLPPLEMISEAAPLGEYYVPQTVRDLLMGGTGGITGTGASNAAMTGRRVLGTERGGGLAKSGLSRIGEATYGPRVMDKVAEHMPTDTLGRLADDTDTSLLGRLMRYVYPNKSITEGKYVPSSSRSTRRTGVTEQVDNLTPEQEIGFASRPNVPVHYRTHKADIPEGIAGSLDAELDLAHSQARKLRTPGASPQQRAFGRRLSGDVRAERGIPGSGAFPRDVLMHGDNAPNAGIPFMEWFQRLQRRGDVPVSPSRPSRPQRRPHDPIERNLTQSDRSFLRSLGIEDSGF